MIKTILFDLDDTLLDFQKAMRNALRKTMLYFDVEPTEERIQMYRNINAVLYREYEQGLISAEDKKIKRWQLLLEHLKRTNSAHEAAAFYETQLGIGHYFINGAEDVLRQLSEKYRLYIASNGYTSIQMSRIVSADIAKYFSGIFISEAIGYEKPDTRFFEACFVSIQNFCRDETIMIGDSLTADIKGGKNAGIRTIWYNPKCITAADIMPDWQIQGLVELNSLLGKI